MLKASTPALLPPTLLDACLSLARCCTRQEVVAAMTTVLAEMVPEGQFDIVWSGDGISRSLLAEKPVLPLATTEQQGQLAAGQLLADDGVVLVPMLAHGTLHGWISLTSGETPDSSLLVWSMQCASALHGINIAADASDAVREEELLHDLQQHNQQLAEIVNVGNALRSSFSVQELADQVVQAIQAVTDAPRVVLGLVEGEPGRVHAIATLGINAPSSRQQRDAGLTLDELGQIVASAAKLGTLTHHVGPHPFLGSFTDAVVIEIPGPRGVLVGTIILDLPEPGMYLSPERVGSLEIIANQAGIALNNARLYTEQQRTVDRLTALNALSLAVSTTELSVDEVINMALAGAVGTTGAEGGGASVTLTGLPTTIHGIGQTGRIDAEWVRQFVPINRDYVELTDQDLPDTIFQDGVQHLVVAPLRGTNLTMGALWIGYAQPATSQAQREMAVLYAKMAGGVLENMYLDGLVVSARDRMASILRSASEGMALIDENGIVGVANRAFGQLLGIDELLWQGRHMDDFCGDHEVLGLPRELRMQICDNVAQVLAGRRENASGEITLAAERDLTWHVLPVRGAAAESTGALLVIHDVTVERRMERLRQDLSNMIVHDLRAPLTNIMVSVDLLLKQSTGPLNESQSRILNIAAVSCQQMLDLVNALLDIRRLQQQTIELQRLPIEVARLADVVVERLERIAEDKRIRLDNELEELPPAFADPDMIRRVLQNLVDNALKFSRPGAQVRLAGRVATADELPGDHAPGRWVVATVQDQGVGIPEEYHQVIFELFTQAPGGYGRGTGVGLAFCKLAVEAHGGRIWVESAPGQGATFYFSLPVA